MGANFVVEHGGQDMLEEEEYDEVAEIIKKVSVVNEDKVEKNENQHDKKKFGDSTAVDAEAGNGGKGNGNKRDEKVDYAQNGYYVFIGIASLILFLCGAATCNFYQNGDKDKYEKYQPIMEELRRTYSQYDST